MRQRPFNCTRDQGTCRAQPFLFLRAFFEPRAEVDGVVWTRDLVARLDLHYNRTCCWARWYTLNGRLSAKKTRTVANVTAATNDRVYFEKHKHIYDRHALKKKERRGKKNYTHHGHLANIRKKYVEMRFPYHK